MAIRVEVLARGRGHPTESESRTIQAWNRELFAPDREVLEAFTWEDKRGLGLNLQTYLDGELVGFAHVFARVARRDGAAVLIGCLGSVMTAKPAQGRGIGKLTVAAASDVILGNLRADFGVLVCAPALLPFYQALGWRRAECRVLIDQPSGKIRWPHDAMILTRDADEPMPAELDLCGPPF